MFIFIINKIRDYFPPLKKLVQKVNQQFFGWLAGKKMFEAKICQWIYKGSILGFSGGRFSLRIEKQIDVVQRWDTVLSYMLQKKIW